MERNIRLDYFKILMSIMVVTTHMHPLFASGNVIGWLLSNGIARIAVPSFFIISGYYIYPKLGDNKAVKKYILRLLLIYLTWAILYLPYYIGSSPKTLAFFSFFGYYHLWYMPATIIGVLLIFYMKKFIRNDIYILYIALALYLTSMIVSNIEGMDYFTVYFFRNGLTFGFMYSMIGCCIRSKDMLKNFKDKSLIPAIIIFTIVVLCEAYYRFYHLRNLGPYQDSMLSIPLLSTAMVIFVLRHPKYISGMGFINVLSSGIYFIHPFVISIITIPFLYGIYKLPVVLIVTAILSFIVYLINKRIKIFF